MTQVFAHQVCVVVGIVLQDSGYARKKPPTTKKEEQVYIRNNVTSFVRLEN